MVLACYIHAYMMKETKYMTGGRNGWAFLMGIPGYAYITELGGL